MTAGLCQLQRLVRPGLSFFMQGLSASRSRLALVSSGFSLLSRSRCPPPASSRVLVGVRFHEQRRPADGKGPASTTRWSLDMRAAVRCGLSIHIRQALAWLTASAAFVHHRLSWRGQQLGLRLRLSISRVRESLVAQQPFPSRPRSNGFGVQLRRPVRRFRSRRPRPRRDLRRLSRRDGAASRGASLKHQRAFVSCNA